MKRQEFQELLDKLEFARRTKDRNVFMGIMKEANASDRENLDEMVEFYDKVLDVLEEFEWLESMIDNAKEILRENPSDSQCRQELGCYYFRLGDLEKAESYFRSSIEHYDNPLAKHYLNELLKKRSYNEGRGEI